MWVLLIDLVSKRLAELIALNLKHIVGIKVRRETLFFLPKSVLVHKISVFKIMHNDCTWTFQDF